MKLSEIFDQLSYGELAQISMGGVGDSGINESNWERILASVNLGLTELHSRFLLKEGTVIVPLVSGTSTYVMNGAAIPQGDLLKIERVYDAEGVELPLNAGGNSYDPLYIGCKTPNYNTLVVPPAVTAGPLTVVYRARHPTIVKELGYFAADQVEVELPESHLNALLMFVASRIMNPIGMNQEFHEGNNYAAKFEQACLLLEQHNLRVDVVEENSRLYRNGWV